MRAPLFPAPVPVPAREKAPTGLRPGRVCYGRGMAEPKSVPASLTEKTEIVLPQHANAIGTAFGGTVMSWIDVCAAVSAQRHCGRVAVTASVDALDFVAPLRVGDVVILRSWVNAAFRTSLEVECVVEKEDPETGRRVLCADAYLTFVNLGADGRPMPVPPLAPATDDERKRANAAERRRAARLEARREAEQDRGRGA